MRKKEPSNGCNADLAFRHDCRVDDGCHRVHTDAYEGDDRGRDFLLFPKQLKSDGGEEEADDDEVDCFQERVAWECFGKDS